MAFAVVVYHFAYWYQVFPAGRFAAYTIKKVGVYGVEGFFIISGFCFFYLYGAEVLSARGLREFHLKRFFRIAPLYYLAVGANLACNLVAGPQHSPRMILENATFTFGLIHPNHSLVVGGWSIGIEYVFYLVFPLLAWGAARSRLFLVAGTLALLACTVPTTFRGIAAIPAYDQKFHLYVQVVNHGFLFFLGGVIAQVRRAWQVRVNTPVFLLLATALLLAFTLKYRNFYDDFDIMVGWPRYYFLLVCAAAVALFAFYDVPDSPLKTAGKWLGEISYSVYVLHPLVQEGIKRAFAAEAGNPWVGFTLGLVLTLALSTLTYRVIEKPMMGLGRRLCGRG